MKVSISVSADYDLWNWLKKRFGRGNVSAYICSLIEEDKARIDGTGGTDGFQSANYARVVSILREEVFKSESYPKFLIWVNSTLGEWMKETHANYDLSATLSEVISSGKLEELVRKWLKYADYEEDDIERYMKLG